jgi:hypothetical protein
MCGTKLCATWPSAFSARIFADILRISINNFKFRIKIIPNYFALFTDFIRQPGSAHAQITENVQGIPA